MPNAAPGQIDRRIYALWRPRPRVNTWDWICQHVRDKDGRPFNPNLFPWARGPAEAFDLPYVREIDLQWATRIGKTFTFEAIALCSWANYPMPSMFCSSVETLAKATVADELYPMLEQCHPLRDQLLPPARRSNARIKLRECSCRIGWAGSISRIAGYGCWLLHANEVDKFPHDESPEGDRLGLLLERGTKQFPDYKALVEGSPSRVGVSRIAARLAHSDDRRFQVPCPWCHTHQQLHLGDNNPASGGLIWDRLPDGADDPQLAYDTARYVCIDCKREIHDEQRSPMMNAGEWVPKGQWLDKKGILHGTPSRPAAAAWGSQLSSLYALSIRWGDIAKKKVESWPRPATRQVFVNGWLGEVFDESTSTTEPEELAEKLEVDTARAVVPAWASFLTASVDRQEWGFEVGIYAWGPGERGHLVDHDVGDSWEDVLELLDRRFPQEGREWHLGIPLTLVDEGHKKKETHRFCKKHSTLARRILTCKGASTDLGGEPYVKRVIGQEAKKAPKRLRRAALAARGLVRVFVAIDYWESLIQDYFDVRRPPEPGSLSFFHGAGEDLEFCKQLLNGARSEQLNRRNETEYLWVKRWLDFPNDQRDVLRMARCAAEMFARGNWARRSQSAIFRQPAPAPRAEGPPPPSPAAADLPAVGPKDDQRRRESFIARPQGRWIRRPS